jgi:hypothetical protein
VLLFSWWWRWLVVVVVVVTILGDVWCLVFAPLLELGTLCQDALG